MRRRVVITGMGVINPMGHSVDEMWQAMRDCGSGVDYTTIFDASNFPSKISAEIKNWDITQAGEDADKWRNAGRHTKFAIGAAKQAVAQSGVLDNGLDPQRLGVYLGAGEGDHGAEQQHQERVFGATGPVSEPLQPAPALHWVRNSRRVWRNRSRIC